MSSVDQDFLVNQLYMKGVDLKEQGDLKKAVTVFELLNEIVPFDESIRNNLIVSYIRSGSLEKAEVFLLGIINNGSKDNVPYKLILAGLQSAKGDLQQSKKTYLDILEYEPSNEEACVFLAKTFQGEGKVKKATSLLRKCLSYDKKNTNLVFYLGQSLLLEGKEKAADKKFKKVLSLDSAYYQAVIARSLIREKQGKLKESLKILRKYLNEVDRENFSILTRVTQIMFELSMVKEISPYLEEMLRQDPENLNLKVRLGIIYSENNKYNEAINVFKSILEKVPDSDRVLYYLGALFQQINQASKAISYYSKIPPTSSLYFDSNLQLGFLLRQEAVSKNEMDKSINQINRLLAKIPSDHEESYKLKKELNFYKAYISFDFEKIDDALATINSNYKNDELNTDQKFFLASLYEKNKNFKQAIDIMLGVIEKDPKNAHALNFVGYVMLENGGGLQNAYEYIKKAIKIEPNDAFIRDSLGWYFFKVGDFERALKEVKQAWDNEKKDVVITKHLAIIHQKLNNDNQAKKYFIEALKNCQKQAEKIDIIKSMDQRLIKRLPASIKPIIP